MLRANKHSWLFGLSFLTLNLACGCFAPLDLGSPQTVTLPKPDPSPNTSDNEIYYPALSSEIAKLDVGTDIGSLTPTYKGTFAYFSITPDFPEDSGLSFDSKTGALSGIITSSFPPIKFTINAWKEAPPTQTQASAQSSSLLKKQSEEGAFLATAKPSASVSVTIEGKRDTKVGNNVKQLIVGIDLGCALLDDKSLKCWGAIAKKLKEEYLPTIKGRVQAISNINEVYYGKNDFCFLINDPEGSTSHINCWFNTRYRHDINGVPGYLPTREIITLPVSLDKAIKIVLLNDGCLVLADGKVLHISLADYNVTVKAEEAVDLVGNATGYGCWMLKNNTVQCTALPPNNPVDFGSTEAVKILASNRVTCIVQKSDGKLRCANPAYQGVADQLAEEDYTSIAAVADGICVRRSDSIECLSAVPSGPIPLPLKFSPFLTDISTLVNNYDENCRIVDACGILPNGGITCSSSVVAQTHCNVEKSKIVQIPSELK